MQSVNLFYILHFTTVEAMKAKLLAPLDDPEMTVLEEAVFDWDIDNWRELPKKIYSKPYSLGGYDWKFYLFPEGNNTPNVSIYLATEPTKSKKTDEEETLSETSNESNEDSDWSVCCLFGLVMSNPNDPSICVSNSANHRFTNEESDWGFTSFCDLRKLFAPVDGFQRPLIENDQVKLQVYIRLINDPTGVLWHNFKNYDSKKETGYVGLKNQGATCYLNSLLQSLYFTTAFKNSVLKIPTDGEPDGVPYALQRVFTKLHRSQNPVGTLELTKSFGWDSADAFTQHDVQELNRVLMDNLEGKMKGTEVEGALNKIFVGQFKSYIKCVNVDYESSRIEDYWDIQLNVKGMRNVEDSFKDYIQVETLDGENQYMLTGYGLQDAKKGVVFKSFPPVLHLQLKRYDFDPIRGDTVKINDRYEFPTEIDLSPYLDEESRNLPENKDCTYALHGVLVHCGDLNIGHYYALLKPTKDGPWYKFDDDRVTRATMKEVLEDNFGGEHPIDPRFRPTRPNSFWKHNSAYMLVYIRKSHIDEILFEDTIPENILKRVEIEDREERNRQREREEQHLYMNVRCATIGKQFRNMRSFDLAVFNDNDLFQNPKEAFADVLKVRKTITAEGFLDLLLQSNPQIDRNTIRLWTMIHRDNRTFRLNDPIVNASVPLAKLQSKDDSGENGICLFVEELSPHFIQSCAASGIDPYAPEVEGRGRRSLIFIKHYNIETQTLSGLMSVVVYSNDKLSTLIPQINKAMNWDDETPLILWEEVKPFMIDRLDEDTTFEQAELDSGDIITFEKVYPKERLEELVNEGAYENAAEYYQFLCNRVPITFKHRIEPESEKDGIVVSYKEPIPDFTVWFDKKKDYNQMASLLAGKLGVEPTHLQFFLMGSNGNIIKGPIKRNISSLEEVLQSYKNVGHHNLGNSIVFGYDVLKMSLAEFETKKIIKYYWLPKEGLIHEQRHEALVAKTATIQQIVLELPEKVGISQSDLDKIKVWAVNAHTFQESLPPHYPVISLQAYNQLCISMMSDEEYALTTDPKMMDSIRLVEVFHFYRDPNQPHGLPFSFALKRGEKFKQTKLRLQKLLGMYDKVFERVKFVIVRKYTPPSQIGRQNKPHIRYLDNQWTSNGLNGNGMDTVDSTDGEDAANQINISNDLNDDDEDFSVAADNIVNNSATSAPNSPVSIDDIELFDEIEEGEVLGLDHIKRNTGRNTGERAIFIKN